jgi:hypothetical protein
VVWVCRDAAEPMVDVHHDLLREVSLMASALHTKYGVKVAEEKHLKGRHSIRKDDEDKLLPNFGGNNFEKDMDESREAIRRTDEALRTSLKATMSALSDFLVQKGWDENASEYSRMVVY